MQYLTPEEVTITISPMSYFDSAHRKAGYSYGYRKNTYNEKGQCVMTDYLVNIITDGTAKLTINGITHLFEKDSICLYKPGCTNSPDYSFHYSCYTFRIYVSKKDTGEKLDGSGKYSCFLDHIPDYSKPDNLSHILRALIAYGQCTDTSSEHIKLKKKIHEAQLIYEFYSIYKEYRDESLSPHPSIKKAIAYFKQNLDQNLPMAEVAKTVGLSPKYFQKIFRNGTGKTPNDYLTDMRLDIAVKKLLTTDMPIADIAFESGFSSQAYFSNVFKAHFHRTPTEFKRWSLQK